MRTSARRLSSETQRTVITKHGQAASIRAPACHYVARVGRVLLSLLGRAAEMLTDGLLCVHADGVSTEDASCVPQLVSPSVGYRPNRIQAGDPFSDDQVMSQM